MTESNFNKQAQFMRLFGPEQGRIEKYCMVLCKDREEAKDLLSEVIYQTYASFENLRSPEKFPNFLFTIAKRQFLKRRRKSGLFQGTELQSEQITDTNPDAASQVDFKILQEALQALPQKLRQAVVLYEIAGFSLSEAATIEECSLSAMKARVMRGRNKLEEVLRDKPDPNNTSEIPEVNIQRTV